jgi:hypothetical protein
MRYLISAPIQLPVGELLLSIYNRHGVRRFLGLLFEELMDALLFGVASFRIIPLNQQLMLLSFREDR